MSKKETESDIECAPRKPGWIKKDGVANAYSDLFDFFVTNTLIENLSDKGKPLSEYGWPKGAWKKLNLKEKLLAETPSIKKELFISVTKCSDLKRKFLSNKLGKGFHKDISFERVVFYNAMGNAFLSLFFHLRNSFAHGRYQIIGDCFVFEGAKTIHGNRNDVAIRARGVLKIETLRLWIKYITSGPKKD